MAQSSTARADFPPGQMSERVIAPPRAESPMGGLDLGPVRMLFANGRSIRYLDQGAGWRYETLLAKEPETIEWIDSFRPGDTFWDIGANVGIYSVYAGVRGIVTHAFEPHFANYLQLCVNVGLNSLQDRVTPLCLAFAGRKALGVLNLASVGFGTSMSNFGDAVDFRGVPFMPAFRQGMIGTDIDSFVRDFGVAVPSHLKIDVDGIELPIVAGARATLCRPELQSVSIELVESDEAQVGEVTEILAGAGLAFVHKRHNAAFATPETGDVLNFLYRKAEPKARWYATSGGDTPHDPVDGAAREPESRDEVIASMVDRVVRRIERAAIDPQPAENIYLEEVFPPEIYAHLLATLPTDEQLDPIDHPEAVTPDGRCTRRLLDLTAKSLERLEEANRPFWQAIIETLTAPALTAAVMAKFARTLGARFPDGLPDIVAVPVFYRDFPGYRIGIHPDMAGKIATLQFYLPADRSQILLGTSFHRRTPHGFVDLKTNPFAPNAAYGFVRTDESWHSVRQLGAGEAIRNSIALTYYIRGEEYSSDTTMAG